MSSDSYKTSTSPKKRKKEKKLKKKLLLSKKLYTIRKVTYEKCFVLFSVPVFVCFLKKDILYSSLSWKLFFLNNLNSIQTILKLNIPPQDVKRKVTKYFPTQNMNAYWQELQVPKKD